MRRKDMNIFRSFRIAAFVAVGLLVGAVGGALGQAGWLAIVSPTGLELVPVNTTGAVQNYVQLSTLRNTTGYQLSSAVSGTVVMAVTTDNLILTAALTGATTVDLPPSPPDGTLASVNNGTASNFTQTITVATTDSSTIVGSASLATLAASSGAEYQYNLSATKWYRLR